MRYKNPNYMKEYYLKNKDKIKEYHKNLFKEKPEVFKEKTRLYYLNNPVKRLLYSTKQTARKYNYDFSLDETDIVIPEYCPYLGIKITNLPKQNDSNPSVDRIDSSKGYVKGNIEVISSKANRMKNNATQEELITFARSILNRINPT